MARGNGLERSIGRLEGKMDTVISSLGKQAIKLDNVENTLSKIEGVCPVFTGKPIYETQANIGIKEKAKKVALPVSITSAIIGVIELIRFLGNGGP